MILPVVVITKKVNYNKRIKTKIRAGYFVKAKVRDMYDNTKEGIIRRISK